jgi:hypothetical protein
LQEARRSNYRDGSNYGAVSLMSADERVLATALLDDNEEDSNRSLCDPTCSRT